MDSYVCGLKVTSNYDNILMVTKSHPDWQDGHANLPGGHVLEGESGLEAMVREWKEEVNEVNYASDWFPRIEIQGQSFYLSIFMWRHRPIRFSIPKGIKGEPVNWYRTIDMLIPRQYRPKELAMPPLLPDLYWVIPLALDENVEGIIHLKDRR